MCVCVCVVCGGYCVLDQTKSFKENKTEFIRWITRNAGCLPNLSVYVSLPKAQELQ